MTIFVSNVPGMEHWHTKHSPAARKHNALVRTFQKGRHAWTSPDSTVQEYFLQVHVTACIERGRAVPSVCQGYDNFLSLLSVPGHFAKTSSRRAHLLVLLLQALWPFD
jgi:hypothetical protein